MCKTMLFFCGQLVYTLGIATIYFTFAIYLEIFNVANGLQKSSTYVFPSDSHFGDDDIIKHPGRSQAINDRWEDPGLVIFLPSEINRTREECIIRLAISIINKYACLPLHIFKINEECGKAEHIVECLKNSKDESKTNSDALAKMQAVGIDPNSLEYYVVVDLSADTCSTYVGRIIENQGLDLGYVEGRGPCTAKVGIPIHEMIHALGYQHEQSRLDRDNYITINEANVKTGGAYQFKKASPDGFFPARDFGPYDFRSIMHYPLNHYSISKDLRTMEIKDGVDPMTNPEQIGSVVELSVGDKAKIRAVTFCRSNSNSFEEFAEQARKVDAMDKRFRRPPSQFSPDSTYLTPIEIKYCGVIPEPRH